MIARIAWENLRPETRARAIALLRAAPADADLASLLPDDGRPLAERERTLFERAATWPDIVRDEAFAERNATYHHGNWHYINHFWEQDANGRPLDVDRLRPQDVNVVERLQALEVSVADPGREAAQRGVDLAWILHLGGDIHQPLHTSARVTATEPEGDRGGNLFKLATEKDDLHWYWDCLLSKAYPRRGQESEAEQIERVVGKLQRRHPRTSFVGQLEPGRYEAWVQTGLALSKTEVYRGVERGKAPGRRYEKKAIRIAVPRIALAGYRLAEILERSLGAAR